MVDVLRPLRRKCKRCGHKWIARILESGVCPKCHSPYWNRKRKRNNELKPTPIKPVFCPDCGFHSGSDKYEPLTICPKCNLARLEIYTLNKGE